MSSLKPLVTMTILVVVGIFLYMRINRTQPIPPVEVDETSLMMPEISAEEGDLPSPSGDDFGGFSPPGPAGGEAPAFSASSVDTPPPAWSPPESATTAPSTPLEESTTSPARDNMLREDTPSSVPALPDLPPLQQPEPTLPKTSAEPPEVTSPGISSMEVTPPPTTPQPGDAGVVHNPFMARTDSTPPQGSTPAETSATPPAGESAFSLPPVGGELVQEDPQEPGEVTTQTISLPQPPLVGETETASTNPGQPVAPAQAVAGATSAFSIARTAIQDSLQRGELSQALLMVSEYYGDPSLSFTEEQEVTRLASQLAGTVLYSKDYHLEPVYKFEAGDRLEELAARHQVSAELLRKINGIPEGQNPAAGSELKILRGPYNAVLDSKRGELRMILNNRYAGRFLLSPRSPASKIPAGSWVVQSKQAAPAGIAGAATPKKIVLAPVGAQAAQASWSIRAEPVSATSAGPSQDTPAIYISPADMDDVLDMLIIGSRITVGG